MWAGWDASTGQCTEAAMLQLKQICRLKYGGNLEVSSLHKLRGDGNYGTVQTYYKVRERYRTTHV